MPLFFKNNKSRAEALYHSNYEDAAAKHRRGEKTHETRVLHSTVIPAAMRGLYAASPRRRIELRPTRIKQLDRVREEEDDDPDDPNDPIIWNPTYAQVNGKRRSELEANIAKYSSVRAELAHHENVMRNDLVVRRQRSARRVRRPQSVKSYASDSDSKSASQTDSDYSCDYHSDGSPDGRSVLVSIYPQARHIEPDETPLKTPSELDHALTDSAGSTAGFDSTTGTFITTDGTDTPCFPHYRDWERDMLPHTEFQILRRRQAMERAREVLEPFYRRVHRYPYRKFRSGNSLIGDGEIQLFDEHLHRVRLDTSRMQYVLRKATLARLNQYSPEFGHAMTKRAEGVRFCEMSDVRGKPIDEALLVDFLKALRKFQDKANVPKDPKLAMVRPGELAQLCAVEQGNSLCRFDSGATMRTCVQQLVPVSHFDWDSSDDESEIPKCLTKISRRII